MSQTLHTRKKCPVWGISSCDAMVCKSKSGLGLDLDLSAIFIEYGLDLMHSHVDLDLRMAGPAHHCCHVISKRSHFL